MKEDKIQLLDEEGKPMYQDQIQMAANDISQIEKADAD